MSYLQKYTMNYNDEHIDIRLNYWVILYDDQNLYVFHETNQYKHFTNTNWHNYIQHL